MSVNFACNEFICVLIYSTVELISVVLYSVAVLNCAKKLYKSNFSLFCMTIEVFMRLLRPKTFLFGHKASNDIYN